MGTSRSLACRADLLYALHSLIGNVLLNLSLLLHSLLNQDSWPKVLLKSCVNIRPVSHSLSLIGVGEAIRSQLEYVEPVASSQECDLSAMGDHDDLLVLR